MGCLRLMTTSDWIQLIALIVVGIYTTLTYFLWRQQKHQFRLAQRPWICPGDVTFHNDPALNELGIFLYNFGRLPAQCKVKVGKIKLKPLPTKPFVDLISEEEVRDLTIFPFVPGVDSVFMFLMRLTTEQQSLLIDDCGIEIHVSISYKELTDTSKSYPYLYSAVLEVHQFKTNIGKQSTLIRGAIAS